MRIAICGGTGDIGEGLALRWAFDTGHEVLIGSRDADRAVGKAREYEAELASRGVDATIEGDENSGAVERADAVVLAVPAYHLVDTVETIVPALVEQPLITPAVGIRHDGDGAHYDPPAAGSVTALAADAAPEGVPVVGALHNLPAGRLADLDHEFDWDTVVVADDEDAGATATALIEGIEGLRALDGGGLGNAAEVEALTPLLINLGCENEGFGSPCVKFR
jgi:NADPH-dependent F420 reductase